ncbi:velvet factor-domain-containing protein [Mucor mucedo]|uniref:velvet factor-domain-containing protein n=1 Tax=Mucor mucedo TaxID=29922 RepID=UPI00221F69DC|nr:velvet factor-domain-containing protein [Mucor mucedo]KAI7886404.1 velvet factor-domain-containing protein [Mucor mucedo]
MSCTYRFMDSSTQLPANRSYDIIQRQHPQQAKVSVSNERDRRSIEPAPILQMKWLNCTSAEQKKSLQSPFYFMVVNIVHTQNQSVLLPSLEYLSGSTVCSLYRLRDIDNTDGGFFVFGDLAVKKAGVYKLHFSLFELVGDKVETHKAMYSNEFTVYTSKQYPGVIESSFLSRTFSDQGIKIKVRKESRSNGDDIKSGTNLRKRKSENSKTKQREVVSPPSYASDDAYFGRWHALNHKSKRQVVPSPTPSLSPTLPSISSPPPNQLHEKWMMMDVDSYISNALPPLHEIMNRNHSYSPFPLDNSFFNRHH